MYIYIHIFIYICIYICTHIEQATRCGGRALSLSGKGLHPLPQESSPLGDIILHILIHRFKMLFYTFSHETKMILHSTP